MLLLLRDDMPKVWPAAGGMKLLPCIVADKLLTLIADWFWLGYALGFLLSCKVGVFLPYSF
jgi:hypothetical protein